MCQHIYGTCLQLMSLVLFLLWRLGFYEVGSRRSGQFTTLNEADLEAAQIHFIQKGENTMALLGKDLDPDTIDMNSSLPGNTLGFTSEHYQSFVFFVRPLAPDRPDDGAEDRTRATNSPGSVARAQGDRTNVGADGKFASQCGFITSFSLPGLTSTTTTTSSANKYGWRKTNHRPREQAQSGCHGYCKPCFRKFYRGWSDIHLNLRIPVDGKLTPTLPFEVQLVHRNMLTLRHDLGGHDAYEKFRFASGIVSAQEGLDSHSSVLVSELYRSRVLNTAVMHTHL